MDNTNNSDVQGPQAAANANADGSGGTLFFECGRYLMPASKYIGNTPDVVGDHPTTVSSSSDGAGTIPDIVGNDPTEVPAGGKRYFN